MTKPESLTIKPELSFMENDERHLVINASEESILDSKIQDIQIYLSQNLGTQKSELEKDQLYKQAQLLWQLLASALKDAKYNFHLNRIQHKFLTDLILTKLEYDVNTVFFAIELTDLLGGMKDVKFSSDKDIVSIPVNATEITYIYHLISQHKVKGLTKDAYTFSKILLRIGNISKVFNYYDTTCKNLSKDIQDWILTFDESVTIDTAKATPLEPQVS